MLLNLRLFSVSIHNWSIRRNGMFSNVKVFCNDIYWICWRWQIFRVWLFFSLLLVSILTLTEFVRHLNIFETVFFRSDVFVLLECLFRLNVPDNSTFFSMEQKGDSGCLHRFTSFWDNPASIKICLQI